MTIIRNLIVGFSILVAAQAASAGLWECNFNLDNTQFSCNTYDPGLPHPNIDPGHGSWRPPGTVNRLIADQSGDSSKKISYIPGCLNGAYPPSSSRSGCAGTSSNESGFTFTTGNVLGLRYTSKPVISSTVKYIQIVSGDGGSPGVTTTAWLSTNPTATYELTDVNCTYKATNSGLFIATGSNYCQIQPSTQYYLFISTDVAGMRYQVDERMSDFE